MAQANIGQELANKLAAVLDGHGFTKRGKSFFRIHGDGVLQILKFEYEVHGQFHDLHVGIQSLYSRLEKNHFTSAWCIPQYSILRLVGERSALRFQEVGRREYQFIYTSTDEQLDILRRKGLPWLDNITTQQKLLESIQFMDALNTDSANLLNDFKIAPLLISGEYDEAIKIFQAILNQNANALKKDFSFDGSDSRFQQLWEQMNDEQRHYLELLRMAMQRDSNAIDDYLKKNYETNCGYAKFCMK